MSLCLSGRPWVRLGSSRARAPTTGSSKHDTKMAASSRGSEAAASLIRMSIPLNCQQTVPSTHQSTALTHLLRSNEKPPSLQHLHLLPPLAPHLCRCRGSATPVLRAHPLRLPRDLHRARPLHHQIGDLPVAPPSADAAAAPLRVGLLLLPAPAQRAARNAV